MTVGDRGTLTVVEALSTVSSFLSRGFRLPTSFYSLCPKPTLSTNIVARACFRYILTESHDHANCLEVAYLSDSPVINLKYGADLSTALSRLMRWMKIQVCPPRSEIMINGAHSRIDSGGSHETLSPRAFHLRQLPVEGPLRTSSLSNCVT